MCETSSSDSTAESSAAAELLVREEVRDADRDDVRRIVQSTGFFYPSEVDVAIELVDERLLKGIASGYHFVFLDDPARGTPLGYACFGPIACTATSFDLYWIAVDRMAQGRGLGRRLLHLTEQLVRQLGGRRLYAETSGREQYEPTRTFYQQMGFFAEAVLKDFYDQDDDKLVYVKVLSAASD